MTSTIIKHRGSVYKVTFDKYNPDVVDGIVTIENLRTKLVQTVPFVGGQIHGDYVAKKNGVVMDKVFVDYNKPMFRS